MEAFPTPTNDDPPALAQPPRETLSTHVERGIREALMAGRFQPGERLNIRALATMLGTSATPVREAMSRLAAEGAIDMVPNQSVRVPEFSRERFEELKLIRMAVEGLAAEQAAVSITTAEIAAREPHLLRMIEGLWARSAPSFRFMYVESAIDLELEGVYADAVAALKRRDGAAARLAIEHAIAIGTDRLKANPPRG
jgi:DNA-binding GntR family transcriptional regulator